MKVATSVIGSVIALIFLTTVLGFAVMCVDMATTHHSMDEVSMVFQHITAYQLFSNTTPVLFFSAVIAALILAFAVFTVYADKIHALTAVGISHTRGEWREYAETYSFSKQKFTSWLSLLENSPSFA